MKPHTYALLPLILLSDCTQLTQLENSFKQTVMTIDQIEAADLQNAIFKAQAAGDKVGAALWTCLLPISQTPHPQSPGPATLLEDARIAQMCIPGPTPIIPGQ